MQHVLMYNTSYKELSIHSGGFAPAMLRSRVYNIEVRRAKGSQVWLALGVWYSKKSLRRRLLCRGSTICVHLPRVQCSSRYTQLAIAAHFSSLGVQP